MVSVCMILFLLVECIFYSRTAGCYPTHPENVFLLKSTHGEILSKEITRILEFFVIEFNSPGEEAVPIVLFY